MQESRAPAMPSFPAVERTTSYHVIIRFKCMKDNAHARGNCPFLFMTPLRPLSIIIQS